MFSISKSVCLYAQTVCPLDQSLPFKVNNYNEYLYDLSINHTKQATLIYFLTDSDNNLYINHCAFENIIPSIYDLEKKSINNYTFYKIPNKVDFTVEIDHQIHAIHFIFPSNVLPKNNIDLNAKNKNYNIVKPNLGTYLNYDLSAQKYESSNKMQFGGIGEWVVYSGQGYLNNTFIANNFAQNKFIRLESFWQTDYPQQMASWRFGDLLSGRDIASNSVRLGGIQFQSNFSTQPYLITYPLPAYAGEAAVPSQLEFYLNEQLRLNQSVQPGPFSIQELPAITGYNEIVVQTTDLLGRAQIAVIPFYVSTHLLRPKLSEFSYELGFIRRNFGINSNDYGRMAAIGTHHYGVTDKWTTGGHVELLEDQQTVGVSNINALGNFGILHTVYSISHHKKKTGNQVLIRFDRQTQRLSYGLQTIASTKDYQQIGFPFYQKPAAYSALIFGGYNHVTMGSINFNYAYQKNRAMDNLSIFLINYNRNIFQEYFVHLNYIQRDRPQLKREFQLSLIWSPKRNYTASLTSAIEDTRFTQRAMLQKSPPLDKGYGYRIALEKNKSTDALIDAIYRNAYAEYTTKYNRLSDTNNFEFNTRGAIISTENNLLFSRTIYDSFAIVNTNGVADINVYEGNNSIGQTNENGYLIVPRLRSYEKNSINIKLNELPIHLEADPLNINIIPYTHSGYKLNFDISYSLNYLFYLVDSNGVPLPTGGGVKIGASDTIYPIGYQAMVFIQSPENSKLPLHGKAFYNNSVCSFKLPIQHHKESIIDLGKIVCQ